MGGVAEEGEEAAAAGEEGGAEVDVSAEGTLVWLRRPNGTWWPSIVISPRDVPAGCPAPPRCAATPIMLLGRRGGPTYVDWCNLARSKRVKPFRCGELDFEQRIAKVLALAASHKSPKSYKGRYGRLEDAVLQALEIERARALEADGKGGCSATPNMGNGGTTKASSSSTHAAAGDCSTVTPPPPSPKRKRKTPNDSEDDAPKGFRRMRDLRDIGSKTVPVDLPNAGTVSSLSCDLPSVTQVKRSKPSHTTPKRKHAAADQDHPCGSARKKDRSRPLSELCNGDMWNRFRANGQKADARSMGMGSCPSSSSGTSSLDAPMDNGSSHRTSALKTDQATGTEFSCSTGLLDENFPHGNHFVETTLAARSILESDHLQAYEPFVSTKYPAWKNNKQSIDFSETDKVRTICSIDQEVSNRTRDALDHEHHKTRAVKHKTQGNEGVLSEKKPAKRSLNKPSLDCVGAVQQQRSVRKCGHEGSSQTMSNNSNCENGSVSSLVAFELPPQALPPEENALDFERPRALKPVKTLQLNSKLYDVELSSQGSDNNGRRVPLVSLMSKWNRRPVVGYPVSVEVLDDAFCLPLSNTVEPLAISSADGLQKKGKSEGLQCTVPSSRTSRAKPKSRRKTSVKEEDKLWQPHTKIPTLGKEEDKLWKPHTKISTLLKEEDKLWRPHTKKPVSSPRKMRRLSSFASNQRDGDARKSVVGKFSGPAIACIPLRVVYSRIKEALRYPAK
ncbi:hypothetical protein ACP4OV_028701 [Aristida adscensionis]